MTPKAVIFLYVSLSLSSPPSYRRTHNPLKSLICETPDHDGDTYNRENIVIADEDFKRLAYRAFPARNAGRSKVHAEGFLRDISKTRLRVSITRNIAGTDRPRLSRILFTTVKYARERYISNLLLICCNLNIRQTEASMREAEK